MEKEKHKNSMFFCVRMIMNQKEKMLLVNLIPLIISIFIAFIGIVSVIGNYYVIFRIYLICSIVLLIITLLQLALNIGYHAKKKVSEYKYITLNIFNIAIIIITYLIVIIHMVTSISYI